MVRKSKRSQHGYKEKPSEGPKEEKHTRGNWEEELITKTENRKVARSN